MKFVKSLSMFHVDAKEIPCLTGKGAPTEKTEGAVGVLYMDTDDESLYKCTDVADGVYTWKPLVEQSVSTDSSQNGGNIDVIGAEVGQIIKIAEVDENGRPTKWESDDFIPRSLPFENMRATLIVDITVSADDTGALPQRVEIISRDSGAPLNLKGFVISTDIKSAYAYTSIGLSNSVEATRWLSPIRTSHGEPRKSTTVFVDADGRILDFGLNSQQGYGYNHFNDQIPMLVPTINKIVIPGGGVISSGTFIKIYELTVLD